MAKRKRRMNAVARTWNNIPGWGQAIFIAAVGTGTFVGGRKIYKNWKLNKDLKNKKKLIEQSNIISQVAITDGSGHTGYLTQNVNLFSIATLIYDAFYNNDIFGYTEDEEKATNALLKVPMQFLPQLEDIYSGSPFKKNLREDFIKFVSDNDTYWNQVKNYF